jgi:dTDP-4-dehydrorhamnose reductase
LKKRIAVIGASGQLGTALQSALPGEVIPLGHKQIELTDVDSVTRALSQSRPDLVINTAAYNFVDRAETDPEIAMLVNAIGPRNVAKFCASQNIPIVHLSTDYVFSGSDSSRTAEGTRSTPYVEEDCPNPLSVYAVSKLAGEQMVRQCGPRHFILRTCGLYGPASIPGTGNFVATMLRLAKERDELHVVDDQICGPTFVADLAEWISKLMTTENYGLYHATNSGQATWCEFARELFRLEQIEIPVIPITTAEFGAPAGRPAYSVLDSGKLSSILDVRIRNWQEALADHLYREKQSTE